MALLFALLLQSDPVKGDHAVAYGDDAEAVVKTLDEIVGRVEAVFGIDVRTVALTRKDGRKIMVIPKPDAAIRKAGAKWEIQWADDLPRGDYFRHEVAHLIFLEAEIGIAKSLEKRKFEKGQYGTVLPDWMDETAAVLGETDLVEERRSTLTYAVKNDKLIPLAEFFTMHHPGHDEGTGGRKDPSAKNFIFYAQCWGFVQYLENSYGLVVMHEMLKLAKKDKPVEGVLDWMARNKGKLAGETPGVPDTLDAFDAAWREWADARWRGKTQPD